MKYFKTKLAFTIMLLSTSCFATPKPEKCPDVAALKAVGVKYAETSLIGWQVASDESNFGTKQAWVLGMMMIGDTSQSESEVLAKANAKIDLLVLSSGPEKSDYNSWQCIYNMPNGEDHTLGIATIVPDKK